MSTSTPTDSSRNGDAPLLELRGLSKSFAKFAPQLKVQAQVVPAQMLNEAGIVGAAMAFSHPEI